MWRESRKQDRHICNIILDRSRKNDEKRQKHIKKAKDPLTFIRVVGTKAKKYVDDGRFLPTFHDLYMVPWEADPSVRIDRFDARAFLDLYSIPKSVPYSMCKDENSVYSSKKPQVEPKLEKLCNYERFKVLVEMKFLNVNEEKFIKRIMSDCGLENKKKESVPEGIMHIYDEGVIVPNNDPVDSEDKSGSFNIDVEELSIIQKTLIDKIAEFYGIESESFCNFLLKEKYHDKYSELIEKEANEIQASKSHTKLDRTNLKKKQIAIRAISGYTDYDDDFYDLQQGNSFLDTDYDYDRKSHYAVRSSSSEQSSDSERPKRRRCKTEKIEYISEFNSASLKNRRVYGMKPSKSHIVEQPVQKLP